MCEMCGGSGYYATGVVDDNTHSEQVALCDCQEPGFEAGRKSVLAQLAEQLPKAYGTGATAANDGYDRGAVAQILSSLNRGTQE